MLHSPAAGRPAPIRRRPASKDDPLPPLRRDLPPTLADMRFRLPLIALFAVCAAAAAQTTAPTLEERMPQAEFRAAGLDKLSPEELKYLNDWLTAHGEAIGPVAAGSADFYPNDADREAIETRISGVFDGWRGHTVFDMDNGQQWRQTESGTYKTGKMENPAVTIKPMMLGSWLMRVEGCGCSVRVERIR
jgi:hypothetical protein